MIAAALLLMLASTAAPAPRAGICQSVANLAQVAAEARRRGVTEAQANAAADELDDSNGARTTARTILWYVYTANGDGRSSPTEVARLVHGACMAPTLNALTGATPYGQ